MRHALEAQKHNIQQSFCFVFKEICANNSYLAPDFFLWQFCAQMLHVKLFTHFYVVTNAYSPCVHKREMEMIKGKGPSDYQLLGDHDYLEH